MVKVDMFEMWSYFCAPLLHDMLLDYVSSTCACCHIFYRSLVSIARTQRKQSFLSQLIYMYIYIYIERERERERESGVYGHQDKLCIVFLDNSRAPWLQWQQPEKFWKHMSLNLHHICFVLLNYFATYTRIQIWKEKEKNFFQ